MGSLSSVIAPIASFGVKAITTAASQILPNLDAYQNINNINEKNKQLAQNLALQRSSNLLSLQEKENDRVLKLRRAISTQRANFGGKGIGSAGGSAESVLQGLNEDSDVDRQINVTKYNLDNAGSDQNYHYQTQLNLLQKQQLKQKSALSFLTNLD